jgi:hypothetical protein
MDLSSEKSLSSFSRHHCENASSCPITNSTDVRVKKAVALKAIVSLDQVINGIAGVCFLWRFAAAGNAVIFI